jgi:hypothetical protein
VGGVPGRASGPIGLARPSPSTVVDYHIQFERNFYSVPYSLARALSATRIAPSERVWDNRRETPEPKLTGNPTTRGYTAVSAEFVAHPGLLIFKASFTLRDDMGSFDNGAPLFAMA